MGSGCSPRGDLHDVDRCLPVASVGGAVPLGSPFYIERPADGEFRAAVTRGDSIVLVKGARQVGKSSPHGS